MIAVDNMEIIAELEQELVAIAGMELVVEMELVAGLGLVIELIQLVILLFYQPLLSPKQLWLQLQPSLQQLSFLQQPQLRLQLFILLRTLLELWLQLQLI